MRFNSIKPERLYDEFYFVPTPIYHVYSPIEVLKWYLITYSYFIICLIMTINVWNALFFKLEGMYVIHWTRVDPFWHHWKIILYVYPYIHLDLLTPYRYIYSYRYALLSVVLYRGNICKCKYLILKYCKIIQQNSLLPIAMKGVWEIIPQE